MKISYKMVKKEEKGLIFQVFVENFFIIVYAYARKFGYGAFYWNAQHLIIATILLVILRGGEQ